MNKNTSFTGLLTATMMVSAVLLFASPAIACPTCKEAIATSEGGDLLSGFFWSIVFMMSMPYAIFGIFGLCVYRSVRKPRPTDMAAASAAADSQASSAEQSDEVVGV